MYFLKSNLKYSDMINMTNNCVAVMPHINNIYSISKISKKNHKETDSSLLQRSRFTWYCYFHSAPCHGGLAQLIVVYTQQ